MSNKDRTKGIVTTETTDGYRGYYGTSFANAYSDYSKLNTNEGRRSSPTPVVREQGGYVSQQGYDSGYESGGSNKETISSTLTDFSGFGDLDMTKYLLESGMQNIFDMYKQNIETLSQQEQKQLQDAYYMKEMSKKYLGEYASNSDIGEVSGNLIDIYSNYQNNINDITKYHDQLEMNYNQSYQQAKFEQLTKILENQYQVNVEKLAEQEQDVLFRISTGDTDGLSVYEFLDREYAENRLSKSAYQTYTMAFLEQTGGVKTSETFNEYSRILFDEDLRVDENGNPLSVTDYIESVKDNLTEQEVQLLKAQSLNIWGEFNQIGTPVQFAYGNQNVSKGVGYISPSGVRYLPVIENAYSQSETWQGDPESVFVTQRGEDATRTTGDVVTGVSATNVENGSIQKWDYVWDGQGWKRLVPETTFSYSEMGLWNTDNADESDNKTWKFDMTGNDEFLVKNADGKWVRYIAKGNTTEAKYSSNNEEDIPEGLKQAFINAHGQENWLTTKDNKGRVVYWNGNFYYMKMRQTQDDQSNIWIMEEKK